MNIYLNDANLIFLVLSIGVIVVGAVKTTTHGLKHLVESKVKHEVDKINPTLQKIQDDNKSLSANINELSKNVLRLQILDGIHTNRFSEDEVLYFYDKYKALGGNGFVSKKVKEYLNNLEKL